MPKQKTKKHGVSFKQLPRVRAVKKRFITGRANQYFGKTIEPGAIDQNSKSAESKRLRRKQNRKQSGESDGTRCVIERHDIHEKPRDASLETSIQEVRLKPSNRRSS